MIKFSDEYKPQPDELISKNKLLMWIADNQMGTDPYTAEGKFEYEILESVFNYIKEMEGIEEALRGEDNE